MKTIIFSGILFINLVFALSAAAQYMSLGPSIGAGISKITGDEPGVDISPQFMWNAGATFVYSTKTHFGFGADLKFCSEGYQSKNSGIIDSLDTNIHLNYVRLPLRVIYFFGEYGGNIRPKVFLGATPGLLVSARSENDLFGESDIKDNLNSFDLGIQAGVGLNIKLAEAIWLNTDLSIYQGVLDLEIAETSNLNQNIGINVGVAFGFGGEKTDTE